MRWEQDLIKDIRTGTAFDNDDGNQRGMIVREFPYSEYGETSPCNKSALLDRFLRVVVIYRNSSISRCFGASWTIYLY
jgi:hypothetical protein